MKRTPVVNLLKEVAQVLWAGIHADRSNEDVFAFDEGHGGVQFTAPGLFQQVNRPLNHVLQALVLRHVQLQAPLRVLDLFCGSGNFTLALARALPTVVFDGVEVDVSAIRVAKFSAKHNGIQNVNFTASPVEKYFQKKRWSYSRCRT